MDELKRQISARDNLRRQLNLWKTPSQRMAAMRELQKIAWATLRRSPAGYAHFLRRNFKARAIHRPTPPHV